MFTRLHTSARVGHTWEGVRSCCPWEPGILGAVTSSKLQAVYSPCFLVCQKGTRGLPSGTLVTPTLELEGGALRGHLGREASLSPGPPGLQQRQEHLDSTHDDGLALLPLQHVAQKLLDRLLPGAGVASVREEGPQTAPPSLWTGHHLQTHFSRVANSWSGSGLSCTWIICSRLRRMMSHRDWDALECCWGRGRQS